MHMSLIRFTEKGLYCEQADVFIDPWRPVDRALITHAHADHSRPGMKHYLAHHLSLPVMKYRLGEIQAEGVEYGEVITINGVEISFHPAGHTPGSAQIKLAYKGEAWVISGDYKIETDGVSTPFEPVKCSHFVTESTFGLPVYSWQSQNEVAKKINHWWQANQEKGLCSVLLGYSFGKAQRLIHMIDPSIGKIYLHGAIANTNEVLAAVGFEFHDAERVTPETPKTAFKGSLVIAPPSALGSAWMKKMNPYSVATASGWMALRGARRRRNLDAGFVLSDHADWDGLNTAVKSTGAENIFVTHGYSNIFSKWLEDQGLNAQVVETEFEGELAEMGESSTKEKEAE
jgi:putative mRNA 3-end processing factor